MIVVPYVIGEVVDLLRETGIYSSWTVTGITYTLTADNTLIDNQWIQVLDSSNVLFGEFQALNVTSNSFDIVSSSDPPTSGNYKSMEPFYMYGHRREISNRLLMQDKDKVYKYQKYPLFALRLPIVEDVDIDGIHEVELNIAILAFTDKNYRAPQRYENVIVPVLVPLYEQFIDALNDVSNINTIGTPEHEKVDRPFWGISETEGNTAYIFNDPLDAIELIDLKIQIVDKTC